MSVRFITACLMALAFIVLGWPQINVVARTLAQSAPPPAVGFGSSIVVGNQPVINRQIYLARVQIQRDGWVVIHQANADGEARAVIGSLELKAGAYRKLPVTLTASVPPGATLIAMLHTDSGVFNTLEFPGVDTPLQVSGATVALPFTILGAAPTAAAPLPVTGIAPTMTAPLTTSAVVLLIAGLVLAFGARPESPVPALPIANEGIWARSRSRGAFLTALYPAYAPRRLRSTGLPL